MALKSIEDEWQAYAAMVLPTTASQAQRDETKQAFFAGAWAMFSGVEEIGEPHVTEQAGASYLGARRAECLAFKDRLMARYAERN